MTIKTLLWFALCFGILVIYSSIAQNV